MLISFLWPVLSYSYENLFSRKEAYEKCLRALNLPLDTYTVISLRDDSVAALLWGLRSKTKKRNPSDTCLKALNHIGSGYVFIKERQDERNGRMIFSMTREKGLKKDRPRFDTVKIQIDRCMDCGEKVD